MRHPEWNYLTRILNLNPHALSSGHLRISRVPRVQCQPEIPSIPVGEEHVREHVNVDRILIDDVGNAQHGVAGNGHRERCIRIHRDRHKVGTGAARLVLDRVHDTIGPHRRRWGYLHHVIHNHRCCFGVVGTRRNHGERTAIRI